jgi:uncharacterized protein YndB with AHSA1/START domain
MKLVDLTVSRLIPGPIAEVFDVWLDPKSPGGPWFGSGRVILDAKVDGLFYHSVEHEGRSWAHYGRFVVLDKPHKIQHTWMSEATKGVETTVTVTLAEKPDGTQITLVHSNVPDDEMGRQHQEGWTFVLGSMAQRFERRRS